MKTFVVILLSFTLGSFQPAATHSPLPQKTIKPSTLSLVSKEACRVAFLLNPSTTDSAYVEVKSCGGVISNIGLKPGSYITTDCLSTDYGITVIAGNVVVDWMQICP